MKRREMQVTAAAVGVAVLMAAGAILIVTTGGPTPELERKTDGRRIVDGEDIVIRDTLPEGAGAAGGSASGDSAREHPPGDPMELGDWLAARDWAEFEQWAAKDLRERLGQGILDKGNQASLMELRELLKEHYPEDWEAKLDGLLRKAFPDLADQVLQTFHRMDAYNEWFEHNKRDLATMAGDEIQEALRQRREEIFGDDAAEIWASESGEQRIRDTLDILEDASHVPLEDRIELFRGAVEEAYGDRGPAPVSDKRQVMAVAFLSMESVQDELKQMGPDERAESLRQIRRTMGVDEARIEEMERLDAEREERWQSGLRYMVERDELARSYEGVQLDEELRFLRERCFGDQAKTIEAEEASGFFRYTRRRVYGRN